VRQFIDALDQLETGGDLETPPGKYVLVTGQSMASHVEQFARLLSASPGVDAGVVAVVNDFYGDSVTVSGLLTGGDIMRALTGIGPDAVVILPPNCLNGDGLFLDGLTPENIETALHVRVVQGEYDPAETITVLESLTGRCI